MEAAVYDTVAVDLAAGAENSFRANGSTLLFAGFLAAYRESTDDVAADDDENRMLPPLESGDRVKLLAIDTAQHFTEPPPRYSEASLVKALEEHGIGRPSTYASIIQTLLYKKYCELINRRFVPTDLGKIVSRFLTGNFERYVDYGFTAAMEDELDNISRGEEEWVPVLERFWVELKKQIDDVTENVTRSDVAMARDIGIDPVSGRPVSVRFGRFGAFAQIGTRDDEDKPKFASLRPHQRMDDLTLADALDLFQLPRTLGEWDDGHPIKVAIGRFGPYVQYGAKKYASLKKEDDPYTVTLERARQVIREKQEIEANRIIKEFPEAGIQVLEWPVWSVHQRRQEERQDSEGSRSEVADDRRMQGAASGSAGTHRWTLGSQDRGPAGNAGGHVEDNEEVCKENCRECRGEHRERRSAPGNVVTKKPAAKKKKAAKKKTPARKKTAAAKKPESSPEP